MTPGALAIRGALLATAAAVAIPGCRERELGHDAGAAPGVATPRPRALYASGAGSFVDVVESARHAVVAIRATTPVKAGPAAMLPGSESAADPALGTGFLIEARGVFVLTNDHIAAAASELRVVVPGGEEVPAKVVGRDVRLDLALLSIDTPRLRPLPMGDSDDLRVGEPVVVLGNPFGDEVTAAAGIISATGHDAAASGLLGAPPGAPGAGAHSPAGATAGATAGAMGFRTLLQTDARIHRGNSGGPMLDVAGQVVGVAVATGDRPGELSFAIPINRVREIVDALRDHGQVARSWLGVLVKPVTRELAQTLGLPRPSGALVTEVKAGSPAARAALRAGDVVLTWGGRAVDHRSMPWVVAATPPGRATPVTVWRNRAELQLPIVTEKMPE